MRGLTNVLEEAEMAVAGFRNACVDRYGGVTESAVGSVRPTERSRTKSARVSREYEHSQRNARSELKDAVAA